MSPCTKPKGEAPLWNVRKCHHSGLRHIPEDEESANETSQWNVTLKRLRVHNLRRDCPMIFNTWWYILLYHRNLDASQSSGSRDPTPPLLSPAQTWLSFGSGLLTLFTCRGAVKTYLTRNRQLLTSGMYQDTQTDTLSVGYTIS
jgi:hypothetical protein